MMAAAPAPAAAPVADAAPKPADKGKPAVAKDDKPQSYVLKLDKYNAPDKIKVIKEIRTITSLGLKESKDLVESTPTVVKRDLKKEDAEAFVKKIKEAGGDASMEPQ